MRIFEVVLRGLAVVLLTLSTSFAAILTIDFEDQVPALLVPENLISNGARFSPNCHYDLLDSGGFLNSQWIGFDTVACGIPAATNPEFLAPFAAPPGSLYVDFSGTPFSLLSVFMVEASWSVSSSNGGFFETPPLGAPASEIAFIGPDWTNIQWLLFTDTALVGLSVGFDNLTVDLPFVVAAPGPLALLVVGVAAIGFARRRRKA